MLKTKEARSMIKKQEKKKTISRKGAKNAKENQDTDKY
jgi:hypothetical protein